MLPNLRKLRLLGGLVSKVAENTTLVGVSSLKPWATPTCLCDVLRANAFATTVPRRRGEDRKQLAASMPKKDDGASGERSIDIDSLIQR